MVRVIRKSDPYVKEDNRPAISLKLEETRVVSSCPYRIHHQFALLLGMMIAKLQKLAEEMRGQDYKHIRISSGRSRKL
jgi:hypothetical protein